MRHSVVPYHYKTLLFISHGKSYYSRTSNISRTSVGNNIVDHSDVVKAAADGASFSTEHLASTGWAERTARQDEKI